MMSTLPPLHYCASRPRIRWWEDQLRRCNTNEFLYVGLTLVSPWEGYVSTL